MEYKEMMTYLTGDNKDALVSLIDIMPHPLGNVWPETAVVNAARVSYLGESKGKDADEKLLLYLLNHKHTSPFEHVIFKFKIKAPVLVWWQWVRHRTWSFNFQSGRYVEFDDSQVWSFPINAWRKQSSNNKQGSDGYLNRDDQEELDDMWDMHEENSMRYYKYAIDKGVAREQARIFLPGFAMMYEAIATIDAHNLMHFLRLRMHKEAQLEIRQYADHLFWYFKLFMPETAAWFENSIKQDKK